MAESKHENTLRFTPGFLRHTFGGAPRITEACRVQYFNQTRPSSNILKMLQLGDENSLLAKPQETST